MDTTKMDSALEKLVGLRMPPFMGRLCYLILTNLFLVSNTRSSTLLTPGDFTSTDIQLICLVVTLLLSVAALFGLALRTLRRVNAKPRQTKSLNVETDNLQKPKLKLNKFELSTQSILWVEKELLNLNQAIHGEDRPPKDPHYFQKIPEILLSKEILFPTDIALAAEQLIRQTKLWLDRNGVRRWDIPFRKPRVEFATNLLNGEPAHIEFLNNETIIRIHPQYVGDPFALSAILCHELAHFILDHNGFRSANLVENEKLTDLFVFKCGQGRIYLQGIIDFTDENGDMSERKFGYLSLEEMAYAHVRCSSQFGQLKEDIAPAHFRGKGFSAVRNCIDFLTLKTSGEICEIVLCSNEHILRISPVQKSQKIRCPKCRWVKKVWLNKSHQVDSLIADGVKCFNSEKYNSALHKFRAAQAVERTNSLPYCWASRTLKRLGKHQDAIRELKKLLEIRPDDDVAQNEMKKLIY